MSEFLNIKNVLILIFALYVIVLVERLMNKTTESDSLIEYQAEKIRLQEEIIDLTNKVYQYESKIIENSISVNGMSSTERDSTRNLLNPR